MQGRPKFRVLFLINFLEQLTLQTTDCLMKIDYFYVLYYTNEGTHLYKKYTVRGAYVRGDEFLIII